jgi:hypothetical protein
VGFSPFTALSKGETVNFTATVDSGESTAGQGTLTVRDQSGNPVAATVSPVALPRYGQATLRATFVVPREASMIKIEAIFRFEGDPFTEPLEFGYGVR